MRLIGLFLLAAWGCAAAESPKQLAEAARALEPEFAATALLRIAGSREVRDRETKVGLLEDAFRLAASAQNPVRLRVLGAMNDPVAAMLDRAYQQGLDTLSLQSRAVLAMIPLDPAKARELFQQMAPVKISGVSCKDTSLPDPSEYYALLPAMVPSTFTDRELRDEKHMQLLATAISGMQSPLQLGPAARMIRGLQVTESQREVLLASYAGVLSGMNADDRSFTYALTQGLSKDIEAMHPNAAIVEAQYGFYGRQLKAGRCEDNIERESLLGLPEGLKSVMGNIMQVGKPAVSGEAPEHRELCESAECKDIIRQYNALIFSSRGTPYSSAERNKEEWQTLLAQLLNTMASWKDDPGATPLELFAQKGKLYSDLANMAPNGNQREAVLRALHGLLDRSELRRSHRAVWFYAVSSLIARASTDPALANIAVELRNSRDPVIAYFASLEAVLPRPAGENVSLF